MTLVLCGVAADSGNVDPVPGVDAEGRFEYVPIPEKGPTTESATYGSLPRRDGEGSLASLLDRVRPRSEGPWIEGAAVAETPVHRDPNLAALTYGEHRPGYVAALRGLEPGDGVGFYAGLADPETGYKARHLIGYFTVAAEPTTIPPGTDPERVRSLLAAHPENAHAHRFAGNGRLYYHDESFTERPETVVLVDGEAPGGLFDRALRLSDRRQGPNYYMDAELVERLAPEGDYLGGFKPAIRCDVDVAELDALLAERGIRAAPSG